MKIDNPERGKHCFDICQTCVAQQRSTPTPPRDHNSFSILDSRFSLSVQPSFDEGGRSLFTRICHSCAYNCAYIYILHIYIPWPVCLCGLRARGVFRVSRFFRNRAFLSSRGIFLKLVSFDDFVVSNCGEVVITLCGLFCY